MDRPWFAFVPNLLSLTRLGMAAAFAWDDRPVVRTWLILSAALTDFLDGWLARRANLASRWGALLDPVADRMFVFTAVCAFLFEGRIDTLGYAQLILRDLMTAIGFLVARAVPWLRPIPFRARLSGKVVTTLQLAALVAVLMQPHLAPTLIRLVGVTSVWAVIDYTLMLWRERAREP